MHDYVGNLIMIIILIIVITIKNNIAIIMTHNFVSV